MFIDPKNPETKTKSVVGSPRNAGLVPGLQKFNSLSRQDDALFGVEGQRFSELKDNVGKRVFGGENIPENISHSRGSNLPPPNPKICSEALIRMCKEMELNQFATFHDFPTRHDFPSGGAPFPNQMLSTHPAEVSTQKGSTKVSKKAREPFPEEGGCGSTGTAKPVLQNPTLLNCQTQRPPQPGLRFSTIHHSMGIEKETRDRMNFKKS